MQCEPGEVANSLIIFGECGSYSGPSMGDVKECAGFAPLETLPAAWYNSYLAKLDCHINDIQKLTSQMQSELVNVIKACGATPSANCLSQTLVAIRKLISDALPVIATGSTAGIVTSSADINKVAVNPTTGVMTPNALRDWTGTTCTIKECIADVVAGTVTNATCFASKTEACWCDIIKGTAVTCAADSAKFAGQTCDQWKAIITGTAVTCAADSAKLGGSAANCYLTCATAALTYLGISACAADSAKLGGSAANCYLTCATAATTYLGISACAADSAKFAGKDYTTAYNDIRSGLTSCKGTVTGVTLNGSTFTVGTNGVATLTGFKPATAGTADDSNKFAGKDYTTAYNDIRSGLTSCTGTVTSVSIACGTTGATGTITDSGTITLSANAFDQYAAISTTTYPGACCIGTVTGISLNGSAFTVDANGVATLTDFKPATAGTADDSNKLGTLDASCYLTCATAATTYLGISACAADSAKLGGYLASCYCRSVNLSSYVYNQGYSNDTGLLIAICDGELVYAAQPSRSNIFIAGCADDTWYGDNNIVLTPAMANFSGCGIDGSVLISPYSIYQSKQNIYDAVGIGNVGELSPNTLLIASGDPQQGQPNTWNEKNICISVIDSMINICWNSAAKLCDIYSAFTYVTHNWSFNPYGSMSGCIDGALLKGNYGWISNKLVFYEDTAILEEITALCTATVHRAGRVTLFT